MKTTYFQTLAVFIALAGMNATDPKALAQDSNATTQASSTVTAPADSPTAPQAPPVAAQNNSAPSLPYGVSQILELQQAKVDDNTIVSYIRNSGNSYGLNADQIIYLRQQGLSSAVLNAMLSQPTPGVIPPTAAVPMPSGPAPSPYYSQQPPPNYGNGAVTPSVSGIDPTAAAAANYYYYQAPYYPYYNSYPYYGYPGYGYYPSGSVQFGWGGGWHGGGWGGGGWHGGGGWRR